MTRIIRIFLSTPNDVEPERNALKALINELNDFVTFLAPEREVKFEVLHYETSMYPDIGGAPQLVVDRQIPDDYDIHFGIMWKRCGTPAKDADSGTIHEFNQALTRREERGRPIIMFYFSNERFEMPSNQDQIDQIAKVMKFKDRLASIGLTVVYPGTESFRERARIGLLRAVADLLRDAPSQQRRASLNNISDERPSKQILDLAHRYEKTRSRMASGGERTQVMTEIFNDMVAEAPQAKRSINRLRDSEYAGERLAAVAILQAFPDVDYLNWLADRLDPSSEKPFIGYQAAVALLQAARSFPVALADEVEKYINKAKTLAAKNPHDPPRINALNYALKEISLKKNVSDP